MVTRTAMIEGHEQTVITPIIKELTKVIENSFINDPDTYNYLKTKYEKENVNVPDFKYDNTIGGPTIDIEYEYKPTEEINVRACRMFPMAKPILYDPETQFTVTPYYQLHEMRVTYRFRGQSKQELINIKNKFYSYYINTDYRLIVNLPFSFQIPLSVIFLANDIKTLKGYKGSVFEYIDSIKTGFLDFSLKRGWKNFQLPYFRGVQVSRYCDILTNPDEMEIEKGDQPEYGITIEILTTFHLPMGVFTDIPMLVNNKPVDEKWLGRGHVVKFVEKNDNELPIVKAISDYYFGYKTTGDIVFKYPTNDEFTIAMNPNRYMWEINWLSILITIDKNNPKLLFNLEDLSYIGVPRDIIDYMKKYKDGLNKIGGAGIKLDLYEDNTIKDKHLYVDDKYNVLVKDDLDLTKRYHVLFKFLTDIHLIDKLDVEGIKETKDMFNKYGIFWFESSGAVVKKLEVTDKGVK